MKAEKRSANRPRMLCARLAALTLAVCALGVAADSEAQGRLLAPMANSNAPFVAWHQGFEHDLEGWYGAETDGALGWCGSIAAVSARGRQGADPRPSAGTGYAVLRTDACNAFWTTLGVPLGVPYAPGPEQALYSGAWPRGGYVTELDVYLDPAWSGQYEGNFGALNGMPESLIQYAITIFPTDPDAEPFHTGPHYLVSVDAVPGVAALEIAGHRIDAAGWHTFRFVLSDDAGEVRVDFELAERSGPVLATVEAVDPTTLLGPFRSPFGDAPPADGYGSGHVWFFDIPLGLGLPIDEHRVRRGR